MKEKFQKILENKIELSIKFINNLSLKDITKVDCYQEIDCTNKVREFQVIFPAGFLLHAISNLPNSKQESLARIKKKLTNFLIKEENSFSYNYYTKTFNKSNKDFLLPDDLDDTALVNAALFKSGISIKPQVLIKIIKLEEAEGGPYRTWYISKQTSKSWQDIDPVVNAHLLYLAALLDINLENTAKFISKQIDLNHVSSRYYPSDMFFYFYISKYISRSKNIELKAKVLKKLAKYKFQKLTKLEKLLYLITLAYLDQKFSDKWLEEVCKLQQKDGGVGMLPFCKDFYFNGKPTFSSNRTVVTAIFLEFLTLVAKTKDIEIFSKSDISNEKFFLKEVQSYLKQDSKTFNQILDNYPIEKALKAIMLPYFALHSYKSKLNSKDKRKLIQIGAASYYGWSGYTLLDKILDEQVYSKEYPIINSLFRKHYFLISEIFSKKVLNKFKDCWEITDKNYYWEANHARISRDLPLNFDYKYIEKRMISFLTICSSIIEVFDKLYFQKKQKSLYSILRSIVLIDQLNDDMHDWRDDIKNNILTYVTYELLKYKNKNLEEVFWEKVVPKITVICRKEYKKAINIINKDNITGTYLNKLLDNSLEPIIIAEKEIQNIKIVGSYYNFTK